MEQMRALGDMLRDRLGSSMVVLGNTYNDKVQFLAMVSRDLTDRLHAGKIIQQVAKITGGGGGGRPDMAQAGGKDASKLSAALEQVYNIVEDML